jgi:hypothetical protein
MAYTSNYADKALGEHGKTKPTKEQKKEAREERREERAASKVKKPFSRENYIRKKTIQEVEGGHRREKRYTRAKY